MVIKNILYLKGQQNHISDSEVTTGFQFMANKQFRMEKNIGNISVRWYLTICSQKPIPLIFI